MKKENTNVPRKSWVMATGIVVILTGAFATVSVSQRTLHTISHRRLSEESVTQNPHARKRNPQHSTSTTSNVPESTMDEGRIVNGDETGAGKYRFIVALYKTDAPNPPLDRPVCGASLITPSIALTAAHCVASIQAAEFGRYDINDNQDVQFFKVLEQRSHLLFDKLTFNYDYALVKFSAAVKDSFLVQLLQTPELPNKMTVMGWGVTEFEGKQPDVLMEANVQRFESSLCRSNYLPDEITENMFCAADIKEGRDACQGDSGGPIMIAGRNVQVGLVSFGNGCADPTFPGVYARINMGYTWIEETICTDLDPEYCINGKLPYVDDNGQVRDVSCDDEKQFTGLGKKMSTRDCNWVAEEPDRRCRWYGDQFCPATCKISRCSSNEKPN